MNIVAVSTACIGAVALQESPLTAVQMLWLNLIMDSLASLALATEQPTDAMLDLPPYSSRQSLLTPTVCCLHTLCVSASVCSDSLWALTIVCVLSQGSQDVFPCVLSADLVFMVLAALSHNGEVVIRCRM